MPTITVAQVPVGIGPPNVLQGLVTVDTANPTITDLTTVTGLQLLVGIPTTPGSTVLTQATWTATIVSATAPSSPGGSTLTWQHVFAITDTQVAGVPVSGIYKVTAMLSVTGFPFAIPCHSRDLYVTTKFGG